VACFAGVETTDAGTDLRVVRVARSTVSLDPVAAAAGIERDLRAVGTRDRALHEKRYLKSDLEFLGATVWQIRKLVKDFSKSHPELDHDELVALVTALWEQPIHERRMTAALLLERYIDRLESHDLPLIDLLIRQSKTWALVDVLAGDIVGALVLRDRDADATLNKWAEDDDFWVRRSALLSMLLPLRHGASFDSFARYADLMIDEKEFFIRKAIGWVLRETAKTRPDEVYEWLATRTDRASGVTMREAVKYLDEERGRELMQAYRERRAATE
jgi:3-methyladenine DNA glycosylase AlkD